MLFQALLQTLIDSLGDIGRCPLTADHLRQGQGLDRLDVLSVGTLSLERDIVRSACLSIARVHEHDRRMVARPRSGAGEVLAQSRPLLLGQFLDLAKSSLLPLDDGCLQCIGILTRCLWCHAEVCRCEDSARIFDLDILDRISFDLHLADLAAVDFGFFYAVDLGHLCSDPCGSAGFHIGQGSVNDLLRGFLHLLDLLFQSLVVLDLAGHRHSLTPIKLVDFDHVSEKTTGVLAHRWFFCLFLALAAMVIYYTTSYMKNNDNL